MHEPPVRRGVEGRERAQKRYHGPHLIVALRCRPGRHASELDPVLDNIEQLIGLPRGEARRQVWWRREHVLHNPGVAELWTAVAGTAAGLIVAGTFEHELGFVERRSLQSQGVGGDGPLLRQLQEPGGDRPVAGAGFDRDDARHGHEKAPNGEHRKERDDRASSSASCPLPHGVSLGGLHMRSGTQSSPRSREGPRRRHHAHGGESNEEQGPSSVAALGPPSPARGAASRSSPAMSQSPPRR